jgi:hypothetical protein
MSKKGGKSPDFYGAAQQQTTENRPNQNTAWGSTSWQQGPGGQWSQNQSLNPGLQGLMDTATQRQQQGIDYSQFGAMPDGAAARDQAIQGAYGQATSRLDPRFQQAEGSIRDRLYNMGLREGDSAYDQEMKNFGQERNDAYNQAMFGAIGQGTQAGASLFGQGLMGRQQAIGEAQSQMNQPLQGLGSLLGMSGSMQMPGFMGSGNYLGAAQAQGQWNQNQQQQFNQLMGSLFGAGGAMGAAYLGRPPVP